MAYVLASLFTSHALSVGIFIYQSWPMCWYLYLPVMAYVLASLFTSHGLCVGIFCEDLYILLTFPTFCRFFDKSNNGLSFPAITAISHSSKRPTALDSIVVSQNKFIICSEI